jgi:hypothetical protein
LVDSFFPIAFMVFLNSHYKPSYYSKRVSPLLSVPK